MKFETIQSNYCNKQELLRKIHIQMCGAGKLPMKFSQKHELKFIQRIRYI